MGPVHITPTQPLPNRGYPGSRYPFRKAVTNLVGWSENLPKPPFPKDDKNVSSKKTPESQGAQPCRHCGSGKHWDNECHHSRKGERQARVNYVQLEEMDYEAQENYDNLYYELDSEDEQDFHEPLQPIDLSSQRVNPSAINLEKEANLEGTNNSSELVGEDTAMNTLNASSNRVEVIPPKSNSKSRDLTLVPKTPLNCNTRRHLARDIARANYSLIENGSAKPLIKLKKYMARPPGCSFLGSKATQVPVTINSLS